MKKWLILLLPAAFCCILQGCSVSRKTHPGQRSDYDVYLLIGQSNMAGRGTLLPSDYNEKMDGIFLLDTAGTPVPATHPFNQYSSIRKTLKIQQMNPGYSFSKRMHALHPDRPVLIVCNPRGGTSILEWMPGTKYYQEAVRRTRQALRYGQLKGIVWHQGCSDATQRTYVYMDHLEEMVSSLRKDLDAGVVPFIAGEIPQWLPYSPAFNRQIRTIEKRIPLSAWVSSAGCPPVAGPDDPHFSREGQIILGERYAHKQDSLSRVAPSGRKRKKMN